MSEKGLSMGRDGRQERKETSLLEDTQDMGDSKQIRAKFARQDCVICHQRRKHGGWREILIEPDIITLTAWQFSDQMLRLSPGTRILEVSYGWNWSNEFNLGCNNYNYQRRTYLFHAGMVQVDASEQVTVWQGHGEGRCGCPHMLSVCDALLQVHSWG